MPEAAAGLTSEQVRRDAVAGMVGLGFSQREASTLVEEITREQALASVEEVIRAVFQRMQKG
jgi:Holliday junction resolvasome RuvABC DNA-binding subunit